MESESLTLITAKLFGSLGSLIFHYFFFFFQSCIHISHTHTYIHYISVIWCTQGPLLGYSEGNASIIRYSHPFHVTEPKVKRNLVKRLGFWTKTSSQRSLNQPPNSECLNLFPVIFYLLNVFSIFFILFSTRLVILVLSGCKPTLRNSLPFPLLHIFFLHVYQHTQHRFIYLEYLVNLYSLRGYFHIYLSHPNFLARVTETKDSVYKMIRNILD